MTLRAATPADFGFIRALVQRPTHAPYLTDEDEAGLAVLDAAVDGEVGELGAGFGGAEAVPGEQEDAGEELEQAVHGRDHEGFPAGRG